MRLLILIITLAGVQLHGQGVLPSFRYQVQQGVFDQLDAEVSFGLSLRQLTLEYCDFALRVRRRQGNRLADVFFDENGIVSVDSRVVDLTTGDTLLLSTFQGSSDLFVQIWYDQSGNSGFDAVQTRRNRQPELIFNTAGSASDKPSILFDGSSWLEIQQPIENVLANSIRGTFLLWTRPTANFNQFSFGTRRPNDWRWSFHINWGDGFLYFDAAEQCCAGNRRVFNSTNINQYNSYVFVRGSNYKTIRIGQNATALNNSFANSFTATGGEFWIGYVDAGISNPYRGNLTEVLMFRDDLDLDLLNLLENNQTDFWQ